MIVAAFISDRADLYIDECLASFQRYVDLSLISAHEIFDDRYHEYGMAGNVQRGFDWAVERQADYVLWVEEDMRFERRVPLREMRDILASHPHLAQCVLKRHPWSHEEVRAGGQMETDPSAYTQHSDAHHTWVEHQTLFSLNPCLIPCEVVELGWPSGQLGVGNESGMTKKCLDLGLSFAYYGARHDDPYVRHVGHQRGEGWRL